MYSLKIGLKVQTRAEPIFPEPPIETSSKSKKQLMIDPVLIAYYFPFHENLCPTDIVFLDIGFTYPVFLYL